LEFEKKVLKLQIHKKKSALMFSLEFWCFFLESLGLAPKKETEVQRVVPVGSLDHRRVHIPGMLVDAWWKLPSKIYYDLLGLLGLLCVKMRIYYDLLGVHHRKLGFDGI
jgi:hypothetical protein